MVAPGAEKEVEVAGWRVKNDNYGAESSEDDNTEEEWERQVGGGWRMSR